MLFSGIEIPKKIHVPDFDMPFLEEFASRHGESVGTYMTASIGLVATWGFMVEKCNFSTDFIHGIADLEDNTVEEFDIPSQIDLQTSSYSARAEIAHTMGFDTDSFDSLNGFEISENSIDYLRICSGFFNRDVEPLISLATALRNVVLQSQKDGKTYTFSPDGNDWFDVELITYPN